MTALALPAGSPDHGVVRWGLCFALAAVAHAAGVLWLLYSPPSPDADFIAGAAVVMIDMPETPAAMPTPPSDLAPGPEEAPSEAAPPPKEETKPPEQTAEVALPEPEPPKPQPPVEEKQATAPPSVAMAVPNEAPPTSGVETPQPPQPPSAALRRWQSGLSAQIARFKRYPAKALAHREQGVARITFTIDRSGRVLESRILESSGSSDLDQELVSMVARAQPLPKPPSDAKEADLVITMGMNFTLK
jgi:protein TonB